MSTCNALVLLEVFPVILGIGDDAGVHRAGDTRDRHKRIDTASSQADDADESLPPLEYEAELPASVREAMYQRYTGDLDELVKRRLVRVTDADMKIISSPVDFVGINVYIPALAVRASEASGYEEVPFSVSHPKMFSDWHRLVPESQYWSPRLLHELWKPKEIYITENGCAAADTVAKDGNVYDYDRVMYLRNGSGRYTEADVKDLPGSKSSRVKSPYAVSD